ncbi:MAG: hypothetical protein AAB446_00140 [Patescibacteria group bacterium]
MRGIKTKDNNKWKKIAAVSALFLVLIILANSVRKVYNKRVESEATLVRMKNELKNLEDRQKNLSASLERLKTVDGLEFEMRKKLNVAQAGESVAIIVDSPEPTMTSVVQISGWQKFKNFVVGLFK